MNSLFTICFAYWLWINYLFRLFAINSLFLTNSLSVSQNHVQYTIFFAHYFTMNPLLYSPIHSVSRFWTRELTMNAVSVSWNHYEFTICFANSLWMLYFVVNSLFIHYLSRECTITSLSFSRIDFEFTWISLLYREFPFNSLSSQIHYEYTIYLADLTMNLL